MGEAEKELECNMRWRRITADKIELSIELNRRMPIIIGEEMDHSIWLSKEFFFQKKDVESIFSLMNI